MTLFLAACVESQPPNQEVPATLQDTAEVHCFYNTPCIKGYRVATEAEVAKAVREGGVAIYTPDMNVQVPSILVNPSNPSFLGGYGFICDHHGCIMDNQDYSPDPNATFIEGCMGGIRGYQTIVCGRFRQ